MSNMRECGEIVMSWGHEAKCVGHFSDFDKLDFLID